MNWNDLHIFLVAVRTGSYSAASKELGIDRTTVGRRVSALEKSLKIELYRYTPAGPEPTPEGKLLLAAANRIEATVKDVRSEINCSITSGTPIRIASSAAIGIEFLTIFNDFQITHPDISFELMGQLDPIEAITQRKADLAIAFVDKPSHRLAGLHIGTARQARYSLKGAVTKKNIAWGHEIEVALPNRWAKSNSLSDLVSVRVNSWEQMKLAVTGGMGSACLWTFLADTIPNLVRLEQPDPSWDSELWLLHRASFPVSDHLSTLMKFLNQKLSDML